MTPPSCFPRVAWLILISSLMLGGCEGEAPSSDRQVEKATMAEPAVTQPSREPVVTGPKPRAVTSDGDARELEWDALIPEDYQPDKLLEEYQPDSMSDDDPRAEELMTKLRELWDQAPVREELDGENVRLPGFVVPLEGDAEETSSFLLVPYYGACVHVPPPPANQTVYVLTEPGKGAPPGLFDVVWVSGTMSVKRITNDTAEAGYTLYATDIEPYE